MGLQYPLGTPCHERWSGEGLVWSSHTKAWKWDWKGKKGDRTPGAVLSWVWGFEDGTTQRKTRWARFQDTQARNRGMAVMVLQERTMAK